MWWRLQSRTCIWQSVYLLDGKYLCLSYISKPEWDIQEQKSRHFKYIFYFVLTWIVFVSILFINFEDIYQTKTRHKHIPLSPLKLLWFPHKMNSRIPKKLLIALKEWIAFSLFALVAATLLTSLPSDLLEFLPYTKWSFLILFLWHFSVFTWRTSLVNLEVLEQMS